MEKSVFQIKAMDCPSEESLIRVTLDGTEGIEFLDFDIPNRKLVVYHLGPVKEIETKLAELKLGSRRLSTGNTNQTFQNEDSGQKKLLWTVLLINFIFFLIEMSTGLISRSMGLVADSLDMLADAFVYGISIYAVGGTVGRKKNIARLAGYFQIVLAILGFGEVLRRFFGTESVPDFTTMIIISFLALIANGICLYLLQGSRSKGEAHMQASMIFTSNDVIINIGVITAGIMVNLLNSNKPDLIIGTVVFALVFRGALRILKLAK